MALYSFWIEYASKGNSNFISWRDITEAFPEDNGLKEFVDQEIPKLAGSDAHNLAEWKKCVAKCEVDNP